MTTPADRKTERRPSSPPPSRGEELLKTFYEIGRALARGSGYDAVSRAVVRACCNLSDADAGSVLVLDPATGGLIYRVGHGLTGAERQISFAPGEGVGGWVVEHGRAAVIRDVRQDPRFVPKKGQAKNIRAMLSVPVRIKNRIVGAITVTSSTPGKFARSHARLISLLAAQVAIDLENARLQALANRDPLTGIANRRRFDEALKDALAAGKTARAPVGVALLDLDHFKSINDKLGHPAGDAVLKQAVERWSAAIRPGDVLARIGGEEFGVILPGADAKRAADVAERLRQRTSGTEFRTRRGNVIVTVSIGVAVANKGDTTIPRLLAKADKALYGAKAAGRNRVQLA